jgi:hypothetical protein
LSKGLAGVKTLTAKQIADKWKLPLATVAKKIAAGVKVEKEHTTSTRQANEIARDHLGERPDYYDKLHKMEKTKVVKEETTTTGMGGLGFRTGTPAIDDDNGYVSTNALAYDPLNGARLDFIKKIHSKLHNSLGFNQFDPTDKKRSNSELVEAKLNELGDYVKDGMPGYEGVSEPIRAIRKNEMKERALSERGKVPADMTAAVERGIYEISAELVGKVSNARFWRGEAPSKTLTRAINKKYIESDKKKEPKPVKEEDNTKPDVNLMGNQKPDAYGYGAKGTTHTVKEETKMDNKELINEALDCILEDNLPEMKDNLMKALQEKAMEKLEERKKEIAANYFAQ